MFSNGRAILAVGDNILALRVIGFIVICDNPQLTCIVEQDLF